MSTLTMMTGKDFTDYNSMALDFETNAHTYEDNDPTNTAKSLTTLSIALNSTCNVQGGHYFMSIVPDFELDRYQWDVLSMYNHVIQTVEAISERQI